MNKDFLKKFSGKRFSIPGEHSVSEAIKKFSPTEKLVFYFVFALFAISALFLLWKVNENLLVSIPQRGGSLSEGVIGTPRFINPLLSISDADRDITSIIYSGLMKLGPEGELVEDLAESFNISEDGLVYTFILKSDLKFHDDSPLTTDDVEFTITMAQDPNLKSPRRGNWEGVAVEKVNQKEIRFILKQPYSPFLENTTLGIMPKHIWRNATSDEFSFSQYNIEPIGSGPYKIKKLKKNQSGIPSEYELSPFKDYALGEPFISKINLKFFQNEKDLISAFKKKKIDALNGLSPETIAELKKDGERVEEILLPRVFGVFFNHNQASVFTNIEVRSALNKALDKKKIIDAVLLGFGEPIEDPVPFYTYDDLGETTDRIQEAKDILERNGWEFSTSTNMYEKETRNENFSLSFSISTGDSPELKRAVEEIKRQWEELGARVDVQIFETGDLNQNVIRPRRYDALFFGEVIGRDLDLYPFWHSSQRNDPGLNIAVYVNNVADKALEDLRSTTNEDLKKESLEAFAQEIRNDKPAVFVYSPYFLYLLPEKIGNVRLEKLTIPSERFSNIHEWYIETSKVWKIFANKKEIIN